MIPQLIEPYRQPFRFEEPFSGPQLVLIRIVSPSRVVRPRMSPVPRPDVGDIVDDMTADPDGVAPAGGMASGCRPLLRPPGLDRTVPWGDFRAMLAPQLAHPERLRPTHRLACRVQVYEVTEPHRLDALGAAIAGHAGAAHEFAPLTDEAAARLGLVPLLTSVRRPRREDDGLVVGERIFRLLLLQDPTLDAALAPRPMPASFPTPPVPGVASAARVADASADGRRRAIPERFSKPWEFQIGREEALYELHRAGFAGPLTRLARHVMRALCGRSDRHRWEMLVSGKELDDQLWGVRPPRAGVGDSRIRAWARRTLEAAGYDVATMLVEWEIYWRRKGV